jgi:3',5'-cyclic-AMP phosphodiesterase
MKNNIRRHLAILTLLPVILLSLVISSAGFASTLYERSLKMLEVKIQASSPDDFTFVVLGDSRDNDEVFKKSLILAKFFNPLFILHGGDVVFTGTEDRFNHFLGMVRNWAQDIPLFVVMGNHELTHNIKSPEGKILFQKLIGPLDYALDIAQLNMKVIVLDNSLYKLTSEQLQYLRQQLTSDRNHNFVAMHVPPKIERWNNDHSFSEGMDDLVRILTEKKVTAAFFSHMHLYDEMTVQGVKYVLTAGAGAPLRNPGYGEPLYHIVVVNVKNGSVSTKMIRIR